MAEPTAAGVIALVLGRVRRLLEAAGLDSSTAGESNLDLSAAVLDAAWTLDLPLADPMALDDAALAGMPLLKLKRLVDLSELRALKTVLGHWAKWDFTAGAVSQSLDQFRKGIEARVAAIEKDVAKPWQTPTSVTPGASASGRMTAGRCIPNDPMPPRRCGPYPPRGC